MTRKTNARLAGFTFLFYIAVAFPSMVLFGRATSGEGIAAKFASIAQHAGDLQRQAGLAAPARHRHRGGDERRTERHSAVQAGADQAVRRLLVARRRHRARHAQDEPEGPLMPADVAKTASESADGADIVTSYGCAGCRRIVTYSGR